jgi:hypothetical protein
MTKMIFRKEMTTGDGEPSSTASWKRTKEGSAIDKGEDDPSNIWK